MDGGKPLYALSASGGSRIRSVGRSPTGSGSASTKEAEMRNFVFFGGTIVANQVNGSETSMATIGATYTVHRSEQTES